MNGRMLGTAVLALMLGSAVPAWADPPDWAPAHGWRAKHEHKHRAEVHHYHAQPMAVMPTPAPVARSGGGCQGELLGTLIGAGAGGALGSAIGDGRGQLAAVAGGTLLGALIGNGIGREMDRADRDCVAGVLEHGQHGRWVSWTNPDTAARYEVLPVRDVRTGSTFCREYTTRAVIGGRTREAFGTACRAPDGRWEIVK